jgi:hypothetical protein
MEQEKQKVTNREFEFEGSKYIIEFPTLSTVREAKYRYAKAFTEALKHGFMTRKKMESMLFQEGDELTQEYLTRRNEIIKLMTEVEEEIQKADKVDTLEYLANLMSIYRNALLREDNSMSSFFANTADQLAEDDKVNFLVCNLVKTKEGKKVWDTEELLLREINSDFIETCKYQVMCLDYNLKPNWEEELPESRAREKAQGLLKVQSISKEENQEEPVIVKVEEVVKEKSEQKESKKRGRKKAVKEA